MVGINRSQLEVTAFFFCLHLKLLDQQLGFQNKTVVGKKTLTHLHISKHK